MGEKITQTNYQIINEREGSTTDITEIQRSTEATMNNDMPTSWIT